MQLLAATALLLALAASPARAGGPFTADLDFDAALAKAKAEGKLLLVDVSVPGWDDCEQMDRATWPDEAVGEWIEAHAVAIQLSAFASPAVVDEFGLQDFPTVLLFRDGKELDRHTGLITPGAFVAWGEAALAGQTEDAVVAGRARELLASEDVEARAKVVFDCIRRGMDEIARQHVLWLWDHTDHDVSWGYLRFAFLPQAMARLAKRDETSAKAFLEILDKADAAMTSADPPDLVRWQEWIALCTALEQSSRVVAWYETHREEHGRLFVQHPPGHDRAWYEAHRDEQGRFFADEDSAAEDLSPWLDPVFEVLLQGGRAVEAVRLFPDLTDHLFGTMEMYRNSSVPDLMLLPRGVVEPWRRSAHAELRSRISLVHAGLRGAGRVTEAAAWAAALLRALDDAESRLALVRATLDIAPDRTVGLATWLDEAEKLGADVGELRARLTKAQPAPTAPAPPAGG